MTPSGHHVEPALITIPTSDAAFREHVHALSRPASPREFEARLRRVFPRVVGRVRSTPGAPGWYIYRDGGWSSSLTGDWWDDPRLPRVVVSGDGWLREADATARGLLRIEDAETSTHYFTDFVLPGTLDDAVSLFQIIGS